ncbi:hypothetical protein [uncultured Winogradskyella sp.]|uniref:hypothetical protein n=1 Tax=uncultured Winogradskyella sp. TaxID=395353 RepID=UPI0030DA0551|tara:strand:+ start:54743 stop:54994 length:252 start_codon:yes stop_codon:yes gene_type:complete
MRKLFLTIITAIAFTFAASAQCDSQSTQVSSSCGITGCFSVKVELTANIESDIANSIATNGTYRRPLNLGEAIMVANALEDLC